MIKRLPISEDLSLPIDAATQTFAFIARKGAGKTYAAGKLAECLMDAHVQVVILDAVGNWWGLRLSADGKSPAYDIPVLGGLRGDIPLEATGGHLVADIVTDTGRSLIVDVSQFNKADRQKFATAFAERLWKQKKSERHPTPVHLIIEESQLIVPENVKGESATMVGIYEEIIRLGRNYGIGVSMITQRPQSVNKEVLNQTECLVVLQVNGAHERKALGLWIVFQGMDKSLLDGLPSLPIGTAYVWSPQWLGILQKIEIAPKKTFDASATPRVGTAQVRRDLKPLNLDDLKDRMAATIEKAKAEDPKELRKQIADLKKQLAVKTPTPAKTVETIKEVEKFALKDSQIKRLESFTEKLSKVGAQLAEVAQGITVAIARVGTNGQKPIQLSTVSPIPSRAPRPLPARRAVPQVQATRSAEDIAGIKGGAFRMLQVLASKPELKLTKPQLGTLAKMKYTGGSFKTYMSRLRSAGLITDDDRYIQITDAGLDQVGSDRLPEPMSSEEVLQQWLNSPAITGGAAKMLENLFNLRREGRGLSRIELAESSNMEASGGSFKTYLSRLRSNGLIQEQAGVIYASDSLFINE